MTRGIRPCQAAQEVASATGRLSADAVFKLTVNNDAPVTVTVAKSATAGNSTTTDLVADVNQALLAAGLAAKVVAVQATDSGGKLLNRVALKSLAGVSALKLNAGQEALVWIDDAQ